MPSFDIVSQVNSMEIENAVNQAKKELANRFDFKGSKAEIVLEATEIKLTAEDAYKVRTLNEMVIGKLAKRGIILAQDLLTYEAKDLARNFDVDLPTAEKLVREVAAIVG